MNNQRRIRATSAPAALQRITELYNGTSADAIAETLQDAHRASADTVLIDARVGGADGEPAPNPLDPDRQPT